MSSDVRRCCPSSTISEFGTPVTFASSLSRTPALPSRDEVVELPVVGVLVPECQSRNELIG